MRPADQLANLCWQRRYDLTIWLEAHPTGSTAATTAEYRWYIEILRPGQQGIGRHGTSLDEAAREALFALDVLE